MSKNQIQFDFQSELEDAVRHNQELSLALEELCALTGLTSLLSTQQARDIYTDIKMQRNLSIAANEIQLAAIQYILDDFQGAVQSLQRLSKLLARSGALDKILNKFPQRFHTYAQILP